MKSANWCFIFAPPAAPWAAEGITDLLFVVLCCIVLCCVVLCCVVCWQGDDMSAEQIAACEKLGILIDKDDQGILLQIFTKPLGDR